MHANLQQVHCPVRAKTNLPGRAFVDNFCYGSKNSLPRVITSTKHFSYLLSEDDLSRRSSLTPKPGKEVPHSNVVLYRWLLYNNTHGCETVTDFSYPIVLL
jgi:hypothetical protein